MLSDVVNAQETLIETLNVQTDDLKTQLSQMQQTHDEELSRHTLNVQKLNKKISNVVSEKDKKIRSLEIAKQNLEKQMDKLREQHNNEIKMLNRRSSIAREELTEQYKRDRASAQEDANRRIRELRQKLEDDQKCTQDACDNKVAYMKHEFDKTCEQNRVTHAEEVATLKQQIEELETKMVKKTKSLERDFAEEMKKVVGQHKSEVYALKRLIEEQEFQMLAARREDEIDALKVTISNLTTTHQKDTKMLHQYTPTS